MAKTDKSTILKTGMAKIAEVAKSAKRGSSRRVVAVGLSLGVLVVGAVAAVAVFRPDLKVVDLVNQKVGAAPTLEQLKVAAAKEPKNAALQLDLAHMAFDQGKRELALGAYDTALGLDPRLQSDRVATNLVSCFGTAQQAAAYNVIVKRKVVGAEAGLRKLVGDKRHPVRTGAVAALDKLGKAQRGDWLSLWVADTREDDCDVRRNAVEKLGTFGDKSAIAALRAADKRDEAETPWYRISCLRSSPEDAQKKILARR
ncbi:MAG: hypothetical protein IPJ65_39270 [Archangiaceae bacterium]|nr:hypothetical protein [Archangiaceae bacterium]